MVGSITPPKAEECPQLVFDPCARFPQGCDGDSHGSLWSEMEGRGVSPSDKAGL